MPPEYDERPTPDGHPARNQVDSAIVPVDIVEDVAAWADELRAMAAIGLLYTNDAYDRDRYGRLQSIAGAMLARITDGGEMHALMAGDVGYVTVKVGVAAAVLDGAGRILLVRRRDNGLWAMPGGWADVGDPPAAMTAREVLEETGLTVSVDRLLGLYDSRTRQFRHPHHIYHLVFRCSILAGEPVATAETLAAAWFTTASLPELAPGHADPVRDAFRAWHDPGLPTVFD
jgi:ADP-ribose pyrophosphatase YjhB (NUDIX family)